MFMSETISSLNILIDSNFFQEIPRKVKRKKNGKKYLELTVLMEIWNFFNHFEKGKK